MDPDGYNEKAATAPPAGWNHDEKAALTNPAPPPYQDVPAAGYPPQPGQGYYHPGQGYPQTGQGYPQPGQGYPPQPQGYGNPPQYGGAPGQPYPAMPGQQYPPQPGTTVTVQPTVMYVTRPPLAHPVKDYLGYSIFTMLCCCLPLGIAALIYSISARDANLSGDQLVAERSSRTSRTLNHVALGIGLTIFILYIIYMVVVVSAFRH